MSKIVKLISILIFVLAALPAYSLDGQSIVTANGSRTLLGSGFTLTTTKNKIIFNGYDITDLIHYIQYSTYSSSPIDILKAIDNKLPEVLRAVNEFNKGHNSKKISSALFFAAAQAHDFEKIKYYINKGADVNYTSPTRLWEKESALGANLCSDSQISDYLKVKGAKLKLNEGNELLYKCKDNVKELSYLMTQNVDWNKKGYAEGNLINYMLAKGKVESEILDVFLKAGALVNNEGFYGVLKHDSPHSDVESILKTNKLLACTPIIRKEKRSDIFSATGFKYVVTEIYPISFVLDFDWSLYKKKGCQEFINCIDFYKNKKLILEALIEAGGKPLNKKEESKINKIRETVK